MITTTTSKDKQHVSIGAKMNPRNTLNHNPMFEFDTAHRVQNQQHQEPYILLANPPNFPHPNAQQIIPSPSVINAFDFHHLPEHQDGTSLYQPPQYAQQMHPVTNHGLAIPAPSNFYDTYYCPASGHHTGYGMNAPLTDGFRVGGSSKRSSAMGDTQYIYAGAAAAPSLMMNPVLLDAAFPVMGSGFPMPGYRGNHIGHSFVPPAANWCDPQPEYRVSNVTGHRQEIGIGGGQRYNDGASTSHNFQSILHHTPVSHPLHGFHPQNIPGASRSDVSHRPPAAATSGRNPINNSNNTTSQQYPSVSHRQQAPEPAGRHSRIRLFRRSQRRGQTPQSIHSRHPDLPSLRLLPEEGLAILEFSGDYEVSNHSIDHHSDMRLDIDYMSYEELLALSEQIGSVKTGLTEEVITAHLKTRVHKSSMEITSASSDEKNDSCVICQDEYEDKDKIGSLDCGHEYHVQCLKKWLPVKNVCPICKSTALVVDKKSG